MRRKEQMKRQNLRAKLQEAGLEAEKIDDIVNYIMDENGKDINTAKANVDDDFAKLKAENEALTKDKNELTTKLDGYKDYDSLKQFKAEYEAKTQKQQRVDFLKSVGCKHPDLFENQIDWSKASYDNEKKVFTGLDDTLKGLKANYKDMFEDKQDNYVQNQFNPNLGAKTTSNQFADDPVMRAYLAKHPDAKIN